MTLIEKIASRHAAWEIKELAELLSCSTDKLYKMVKTNRIPHIRMGAMIRFDPTATANWLKKISV